MLPALGICAGVGVEGQADGALRVGQQWKHDEEQGCPGAGPAGRHGAPQGQAAWLGRLLGSDPTFANPLNPTFVEQ